jgi:hypothetical protein
MTWSKPKLVAVNMNAEIGAYQNDFDGDRPLFVASQSASERASTDEKREPALFDRPAL